MAVATNDGWGRRVAPPLWKEMRLQIEGKGRAKRRRPKAYGKETRVLGDGGEENGGVSIEESSDARGANERRRVA